MQQQPVWEISWPVIAVLAMVVVIAWQAINHRRGLPLVLVACALLIAGGVVFYWMEYQKTLAYGSSVIIVHETTALEDHSHGEAHEPVQQPAWVRQTPQKVNGEFVFTVTAGPYATTQECEKQLTQELRKSVDAFIDNFLEPGAGRRVDLE